MAAGQKPSAAQKPNSPRPSNPPAPRIVRPAPARPVVIQRAEEMQELPDVPYKTMRSKIVELRSQKVNERGFFYTPRLTTKQIVDALFREFMGLGVGYDLGMGVDIAVLGNHWSVKPKLPHQKTREAFGGNCIALANAFATILDEAEVKAKAVEVRKQQKGNAFVVHCPHFIDPEVRGHIYKDNILWAQHYLFSNHMAVWVPDVGVYYDPMAGVTYRNLSEAIAMELSALDIEENKWSGMYQGREYILTRREDLGYAPGSFTKFDMKIVPQGYMASPLGTFKKGDK